MTLFIGTVKYDRVNESGVIQKISEKYLFDAISYTDAEKVLTEKMEPYISGEFEIADIKKQNIAEVLCSTESEDDKWFLVKVATIYLDEKTNKEKRTIYRYYVQSETLERAVQIILTETKKWLTASLLVSINETPVVDYFQQKD